MTTESIGTARLDIVVDTSSLDAGVTKAKRSTQDFGKSYEETSKKTEQATKRQIDALNRQIATLGLSRDEVIRWRIEQQTSGKVTEQLTAKLEAQVATLRKGGVAFNQFGLSAKQQQQALRGLPAQVTDIFTSLASGQRPLQVLLQQGGQLKDMFGGIVPATKALGSSLLALVNPYTVAAAAAGALFIAWKQVEDETEALNKALILTGNNANITADQLGLMAARIDATTGVTQGKAANALAQVAATGKFTADQIELVAKAAVNMQDATGRAVEKTIAEFASLKGDPVDAILKLNDAMGDGTNVTNFLTQAQLDAIQKFKEQGKEADATAIAVKAYADALNSAAPQVVQNLGEWSALWRDIKHAAGEAGDAAKGFFRDSQASWLVSQSFRNLFGISRREEKPDFSNVQSGSASPKVDTERARAALDFDKEALKFATDRQRMEKEITEARALGTKAGKTDLEIEKRVAEIRASHARKGAKSGNAIEGAQNRAALQDFKDRLKEEQGAIANSTQLLQAQYAARLVTVEDYYAKQKELAQRGKDAEEKSLLGQISVLKARNVTGKEGIDTARELGQLESELAKIRADSSTKLAILNIQEADALKQRRLAAEAYKSALDEREAALQADLDSQVARIGMGEREFEIQSRINEIYRQQAKELTELARLRSAGSIDDETFRERQDQLRESTENEVQIVRSGYERMAEAQANWANGAAKAYADIRDQAADVAGFTYDIFRDAFDGLSDVITDFLTTGKSDWKDYFNDLGRQITKFVVDQQLTKWMESLGGAAKGGGGGQSGDWIGQLFSMFAWSGGGGPGWAKGGAFDNGMPVRAFADGGVVDRTTGFFTADGRRNVMGEAGPEAIIPLTRGRDGKLGVRMEGGGGTSYGDFHMTQNVVVQGRITNETKNQLELASFRGGAKAARRR